MHGSEARTITDGLSIDGWMPSALGIFVKFFASCISGTTNVTVRETTGFSFLT